MKTCRTFLPIATLCLGGIVLFSPLAASATTYTTYVTSAANSGNVVNYGLTDSSQVVLQNNAGTGPTFTVFTPPSTFTSAGSVPPVLPYDNGVSCTPTNTGSLVVYRTGQCNGGLEVFEASLDGGLTYGLYNGSNPITNLIYAPGHYEFINLLLDSRGDVAAVMAGGPQADSNYLFVASAPEPSSLMLMGTGLVSAVAMARRRFWV